MPLFPRDVPLTKRGFDLIVAIPGLILLSPIMLVITLLILLQQGFPILFRQRRPGFHGKPFTIYKFRTMAENTSGLGETLTEDQRITALGRVLRAWSLDEIPELFNVIIGDMSIVGPRPLLMQYLSRYNQEQARRHEVLPGITGWAQINGRNAISWEQKFELDVWYVDNWSFWLDIKIILLTIWKVIIREGINEPGYISAGEFLGSQNNNND